MARINPDMPASEKEVDERDLVANQGDDQAFGRDLYSDASEGKEQPEVALPPRRQVEIKTIPQTRKAEPSKPASKPLVETLDTEEARTVLHETAMMMHVEERDARQEATTTLAKFNSALKLGHVLTSTIAGVAAEGKEVFWVCYENNVTVRIPTRESFMIVPDDLLKDDRPETLQRQIQFLGKAIGAEISYVLTSYVADPDGEGDVFYASRTAALKRQRKRFFGKNARVTLKPGMDIYGQIISLAPYVAYITCCGLDIRVANYQLSHRYIPDVSAKYSVGQQIRVRIVEVNNAEPDKNPSLKVSGRLCELDALRPNLKRLHLTQNQRNATPPRFMGTITSLTREKSSDTPRVVISLFLEGVELPAFSRSMNLSLQDKLHTGDKVYFECNGYTPTGYVYGSIVRFVRSLN